MKYLDLAFPAAESNLACDEALLDASEEELDDQFLRVWESPVYFVVLGSSNRAAVEVNLPECSADRIPVIRRRSGGGAVLQGPGCLNYCLILRIEDSLSTISGTNNLVLGKHRDVLKKITGADVGIRGISDLAIGGLKCSGNSQRRRLRYLMIHGTFLFGLDISLIERYLFLPSRQPGYREGRLHSAFLTNLDVDPNKLKEALRRTWGAEEAIRFTQEERMYRLVTLRYANKSWNLRM